VAAPSNSRTFSNMELSRPAGAHRSSPLPHVGIANCPASTVSIGSTTTAPRASESLTFPLLTQKSHPAETSNRDDLCCATRSNIAH
jgi:hypothetical protein